MIFNAVTVVIDFISAHYTTSVHPSADRLIGRQMILLPAAISTAPLGFGAAVLACHVKHAVAVDTTRIVVRARYVLFFLSLLSYDPATDIVKRFTAPSAAVKVRAHADNNNGNKTEILYRNCETTGGRGRRPSAPERGFMATFRPRASRHNALLPYTAQWNAIGCRRPF